MLGQHVHHCTASVIFDITLIGCNDFPIEDSNFSQWPSSVECMTWSYYYYILHFTTLHKLVEEENKLVTAATSIDAFVF